MATTMVVHLNSPSLDVFTWALRAHHKKVTTKMPLENYTYKSEQTQASGHVKYFHRCAENIGWEPNFWIELKMIKWPMSGHNWTAFTQKLPHPEPAKFQFNWLIIIMEYFLSQLFVICLIECTILNFVPHKMERLVKMFWISTHLK